MAADHNPYLPPAATVGDVDVADLRKRPVSVIVAIVLLGIHILMGAYGFVRLLHLYVSGGGTSLIVLGVQIAKWLILLLICYQFWRGRNWARILLSVMTVLALLAVVAWIWAATRFPAAVKFQLDAREIANMLLPTVTYLTASFLVFVPGRAWFARRRS
jgi:hypothetical protein